jgi:hypothetical protein
MLQVIKLILIDELDVIEEKVQSFMKFQNKDLEDEFSIPNQIDECEFFEFELNDESSIVVNCKDDRFLYFDLLNQSGVNYKTEDVTSLYFKNKLSDFVPETDVDRFNQFLTKSLSVDNVLDKISESGIDSLNDVDKMVLQRA